MKFRTNKKNLYNALQHIIGVVPSKTTIPILTNILIDLEGNNLTLSGTDLEVSISTKMEVQGEENGAVAIPAKVLYEVVRELPEVPIQIESDDEFKILLTTEKGFYKLSGESKEAFPKISIEETHGGFEIDAEHFSRMINNTIFAVSTDELRTTLMGVLLQTLANELRMVSTDGHRLVKVVYKNFKAPDLQVESIIPTKALNLLLKNLEANDKVKVEFSENHILFHLKDTSIISKCIEGQFPNYERVIPIDNPYELIVNREQLMSSVRRVSIFSNTITYQVRFSISKDSLTIQSEDIEFGGEAKESIPASFNGDSFDVGYNANYIIDILRHIDTEEIIFKLRDPISAGIIYPITQKQDEELMMLLMPIRLNEE